MKFSDPGSNGRTASDCTRSKAPVGPTHHSRLAERSLVMTGMAMSPQHSVLQVKHSSPPLA
jgi:hypothetical protein